VFIPIAEETGLIRNLGRKMIEESCTVTKELLSIVPEFVMHVNLSSLQLQDEEIMRDLKGAMEQSELTARHLAVELTETVFVQETDYANKILRRIREMGIGIALDDFGTGYSSLSYLNHMQVDIIKLDRSFVLKLPGDKKTKAMIEHLTALLHQLGYRIIIEGVEEEDQYQYLKSIGCDALQGYFFYRPMTYEQLRELLMD
jgi:EAL domain-containing protein (putative c-di-GMP-specific phosphodiesterase class I)